MRKKSFVYLALIIVLASIPFVNAEESTYLDKSLTLDQVYDLTLNNSVLYQNKVDALEAAQKNYDDAIFDRINKIDYSASNADEYLNKFLLSYYVEEKETYLEWAKQDVINAEIDVNISAEKAYLKMYQLADDIAIKSAEYDIAVKNQENAKVRLELGQITETEYESFNATVMMRKLELDKSNQNYILEQMDFNLMIGYPIDTSISVVSNIDTETEINYNLPILSDNYEKNDPEVTRKKEQHELNIKKKDIVDDNYVSSSNSVNISYAGKPSYYTALTEEIDNYEKDLSKIINDGQIDLTIKYNELLNLETTVQIDKLNDEKADNILKANELKLSMGLVSQNDVEMAKESAYNAKVTLKNDQNGLYIKNLEFEHENNFLTNTSNVDVEELVKQYGSDPDQY